MSVVIVEVLRSVFRLSCFRGGRLCHGPCGRPVRLCCGCFLWSFRGKCCRGVRRWFGSRWSRSPVWPSGCPRRAHWRRIDLGQTGRHWAAWNVAQFRSLSRQSALWPWCRRRSRSVGQGPSVFPSYDFQSFQFRQRTRTYNDIPCFSSDDVSRVRQFAAVCVRRGHCDPVPVRPLHRPAGNKGF